MDGMKLSPSSQFTWSIVFLSLGLFFFSLSFLSWATFFTHFFFWFPPSLTQFFFWELLSTPPMYLPPFHHPTHLTPTTYPTTRLQALPSPKFQNHKELVELVELAKVVELKELLELGKFRKFLELVKVVELGELMELKAQNIKWSLHFEGKCFFSYFFFLLLDLG